MKCAFITSNLYTYLDCDCDIQGSATLACQSDGSCIFKAHFKGYKCTECLGPGYINPGCKGTRPKGKKVKIQ